MVYGNSVLHDAGALRRQAAEKQPARIRPPEATDGHAVWSLVRASGSLDENSLYCNLLQCSHFAGTCAIATHGDEVVGWLSGYVPPEQPQTYFVWQVCVAEVAKGHGLARRLVGNVLHRPVCAGVTHVDCTITHDNEASWSLFTGIARRLDAQLQQVEHFLRDAHFGGRHETEYAVSIGPFRHDRVARLSGDA